MEQEQYNEYLDQLRDSGVTNMWGASVYLEEEFDIPPKEAKDALVAWMTGKSASDANSPCV